MTDISSLRRDALRIWQAGVAAVRSERLVADALRVEGRTLLIGDEEIDLDEIGRIAVVGAGKAGAGMAAAVEAILGPRLMEEKQLVGWVNVPADCVPLSHARSVDESTDRARERGAIQRITLHAGRPPGVNEPTEAGVFGAERILEIVASLGPRDLCLCLISGGGSALLPAPIEGITLADKLEVTRFLSSVGANIEQLNTVRKQLSRIKGGGLARACRAGRLVSLIISDVLGDPLDLIASGPTVENTTTAADALGVLDTFAARDAGLPQRIFEYLERMGTGSEPSSAGNEKSGRGEVPVPFLSGRGGGDEGGRQQGNATNPHPQPLSHDIEHGPTAPYSTSRERGACRVTNLIIGNNARAVDAAGMEAERLGYAHAMISAPRSEGPAEEVGRHLAEMSLHMRGTAGPNCLISGGEPVVSLIDAVHRGLGGRNQQLALAAVARLWDDGAAGIVVLSGGTDGEDGPTDAAGAICDSAAINAAKHLQLDPADFLLRNDAYRFFRHTAALIKTGPTHTNVCDLRVVLVERRTE